MRNLTKWFSGLVSEKKSSQNIPDQVPVVQTLPDIGIEWVNIPEGEFTMGSNILEKYRSNDELLHQVKVSSFKMSKYAVTFEQYDIFCESTGIEKPPDQGWGRDKRPVINVSWEEAINFAKWMGCDLPTEAEWEYACRAGTTTPFSTGNCLSSAQANYNGHYPYHGCDEGEDVRMTLPVGSFSPNSWGLFDMHGNVYEWCKDWYGDYTNTNQINPTGPNLGSLRVARGGRWGDEARFCRSAYREHFHPEHQSPSIGFRLVLRK